MIRNIQGSQFVQVDGGTPSTSYFQNGQPMSGMIRYYNNNFEVYDGSTWLTISPGYASIKLSPQAEKALEWVFNKIEEEQVLISLPNDHPAIKAAKDNVNRAKLALQDAEDQLKITMALSEDQ